MVGEDAEAELKANHPDLYEKKYKEMAASLHICRG